MTKKQKKVLYQIIAAVILIVILKLLPAFPTPVELVLYLIPYLVVGWDVLRKALKGIKNRQPFDECFLMAVATVGAFALGDYVEGCAVILFYQIGELFQSVAVGKSRQSISSLMNIRPDYANIEDADGRLEQVDPDDVEVGTVIVVQPGERVPIDGVIVEGTSALNTAALTGESLPRDVQTGDEVISGCVNMTGLLKVRTTKEFGESTVSKILDLVENSSMKKARTENFITRFARVYTPAVCYSALALAFIPPVILLLMGQPARFGDWIYRALTFLVISCPCALVISIPLSFFGGIGGASACGILVKGSTYLEELARTGIVVFDKTGTLTQGTFKVVGVHPEHGVTEDALVEAAALAESWSKHPISLSIKAAYGRDIDASRVTDVQELGGHGVTAKVDGKTVAAGNARLMAKLGLTAPEVTEPGTLVHVAIEGQYAGYLLIADVVKPHSAQAIRSLKSAGVRKTVMLTGDAEPVARAVANQLGLDEYHAGLLPGDKVDQIETLLAAKGPKENLAFVGDGINDAPALRAADIGISVDGAVDIAREAADIILLEKSLMVLEEGVIEGRRTFANMLKYIKMTASSNFGNVFSVLVASAFLPFLPMLPLHLLIQNLLYDVSQVAIPFDNVDDEQIRKPQRWNPADLGRFMVFFGPISSIFDILTFGLMWWVFHANTVEMQTLFQSGWFIEGLLSQTLIVHMIRTRRIPFVQSRAAWPLFAMTLVVMAVGIALPFSPLASYLQLQALPLSYFPWLVAILAGYMVLTQAVKGFYSRRYGWQ